MKARRWLPYRHLQSRRLGLVLATARVLAWIGMLLVAAGIAYAVAAAIHNAGAPASLVLGMLVGLVGYGLAALVVSGVLAALVGIEEAMYRSAGPLPGSPLE